MKRILIIGMSPILGGVETYLYNLVKFIDKSKYTFDFLIIGTNKKSVFENEMNNLFEDGETHFFYSPNLKKEYLKARRWLKDFYRMHTYDLIYLNTCTSARINYCIDALKSKKTKLITHSHNGFGLSVLNNFLYRAKMRRYCAKKLACSDIAADWLYGKSDKETIIIPNGVDLERFKYRVEYRNAVRNQLGITEEKIVIGHVGRFFAQKNHNFFIDLSKRLDDKYVFLCIGDGELKESFANKINTENLKERFLILSSKNDIERYYSAMDVFAMPSFFEGLPIVAVEAQAVGLPCIFSTTISKQVAFSDKCNFIAIENVDYWVKQIETMEYKKYDGKKTVQEAGFDLINMIHMVEKQFEEVLK